MVTTRFGQGKTAVLNPFVPVDSGQSLRAGTAAWGLQEGPLVVTHSGLHQSGYTRFYDQRVSV